MSESPRITLRQLRYFVTLAETLHFRRAAERESISQPSLSLQIQRLESVLGTTLVERGNGPVVLTPVGREVLERARRVLADASEIEQLPMQSDDGLGGVLRLGVSPTLGAYLMPQTVAQLHREHRSLRLHVREGLPEDLIAALVVGDHDMVLAQLPVADARVQVERLFREPLLVAMAADDPLARADRLEPSDLAGRGLLTLSPQYRLSDQVRAIANAAGAIVLRDYEGTSLDAIRQMAGMGMGLALLPELYVRQKIRGGEGEDVVVRPIRGGRWYREIGLIWRVGSGRAPAYRRIGAVIQQIVANAGVR